MEEESISFFGPFWIDALVYGCLFALMAMGCTLIYMTTRIPNFAHGSFVTVGAYMAFTLNYFVGLSPYHAALPAFFLGGALAIFMYKVILKPLRNRRSSLVTLMIATFAIDIGFQGIFGIYSDMLTNLYLIADSKYFLLGNTDISLLGMKGLIFICPISLAGITMALWLVLTRTKFGIAMRAAVENPNLAGTLGINVERVYVVSWFISGGLACLAGTYVVLWLPGSPHVGSDLLISMFAASVLGGLFSVFGAVIGGLMVGGGEVLLTVYASRLLGSWVSVWQSGVPMLIFAVTLLIVPQGVTSVKWDHVILWLRRRK